MQSSTLYLTAAAEKQAVVAALGTALAFGEKALGVRPGLAPACSG